MVFTGDILGNVNNGFSNLTSRLGSQAASTANNLTQIVDNLSGTDGVVNIGDARQLNFGNVVTEGLENLPSSFSPSIGANLGSVAQVFNQVGSIGNPFSGFEGLAAQFGANFSPGFNRGQSAFSSAGGGTAGDSRVRISAKSAYTEGFQGPGAPLQATNGILFPYTPNINVQHQVEYSTYDLVHTNYQPNAYSKTRTPAIQITGIFASQTPEEALYTVGVMHFLRVVSKMNFGQSSNPGTPPPVLELSGHGQYHFNRVPVLVGGFNFIYTDDVDYVQISGDNNSNLKVPVIMTIAIDLLPQYSPGKQNSFSIESFSDGSLYAGGFI